MDSTLTKEEAKAAEDKTAADARAAQKAAATVAKREADERAATKAHLSEILLLRGLARAFSPHGSEDLAGALDAIANALASGRKIDDATLVEIAIALKNTGPNGPDFGAMVKKINELLRPVAVQDRTVVGILSAVERRELTVDQGQQLLNDVPKAVSPGPQLHTTAETDAEYKAWLAERNKAKNG